MRLRFIINPKSGIGKQMKIQELINKYLSNFESSIVYTTQKGDATEISKKAVKEKIDVIVAVGGDGTVHECLKPLIRSNTALAVIPCGSGNGFAYHIGMKKNIKKAIIQLNDCRIKIIDSGTVNGIPFLNIGGVGFDAHISNLFNNNGKRGFSNYLKLILTQLSYKKNNYTIEYNNIKRDLGAFLIAFANASQYGNNIYISPLSNIDDGLINFVILKEFPKWKVPIILFMIIIRKVHLSQYVETIKAKEMKISTKNYLIHLDGESYKLNTPIRINIEPKTLKIFTPNG